MAGHGVEINFRKTTEAFITRIRKAGNGLGSVHTTPFESVTESCLDHFLTESCINNMQDCPHRSDGNETDGCIVAEIITFLAAGHIDPTTDLPGKIILIPQLIDLIHSERKKYLLALGYLREQGVNLSMVGNPLIELMKIAKKLADQGERPELVQKINNLAKFTAVLMVDVDHFKRINDKFGHPAGDAVLRGISKILSDSVKPSDWVARYGGEEFIIVIHNAPLDAIYRVCKRLLYNIRENAITYLYKYLLGNMNLPSEIIGNFSKNELRHALQKKLGNQFPNVPGAITISIGASTSGDWDLEDEKAEADVTRIIVPSDIAVYEAKRERDRAMLFERTAPSETKNSKERMGR